MVVLMLGKQATNRKRSQYETVSNFIHQRGVFSYIGLAGCELAGDIFKLECGSEHFGLGSLVLLSGLENE
jgi:hypothetical protein